MRWERSPRLALDWRVARPSFRCSACSLALTVTAAFAQDSSGVRYSVGGEYRFRVDRYTQPSFTSVQHRIQLDGGVQLGSVLGAYIQFADDLESGRKPGPRPFDKSAVDLAQGFVDLTLMGWRLRLGRQEVAVGRYISIRDGTNIRRTFDGATLDGTLAGFVITSLLARATRNRPGAFDDDASPIDGVALLVIEHALPLDHVKLDLTAIGHHNTLADYTPGVGNEQRGTLGVRILGAENGWDVDAQASYQFGRFTPRHGATLAISAWGVAFEGGKTFAAPWSPRLAARIDEASGGVETGAGHLGTFDLPYPNLAYLTDAAIIAPRNVHDVQPFASVSPAKSLTLTAGAEFLWRTSARDAVFSAANTPIIGPGGRGAYIATQPYGRLVWRLAPWLEARSSVVHAVLRGRPLDFVFGSLTVAF